MQYAQRYQNIFTCTQQRSKAPQDKIQDQLGKVVHCNTLATADAAVAEVPRKLSRKQGLYITSRKLRGNAKDFKCHSGSQNPSRKSMAEEIRNGQAGVPEGFEQCSPRHALASPCIQRGLEMEPDRNLWRIWRYRNLPDICDILGS